MKYVLRARLGAGLLFALAGAALAGCGGGEKPIATVNGQAISEKEFGDRCANTVVSQASSRAVALDVLTAAIITKIMEKQLQQGNLAPTDQDVDRRFEVIRNQGKFTGSPIDERLKMEGRSEAAFKRDLRDNMIQEAFHLRDVKVSDAEARQYYDAHKDNPNWSMKERIRISEIIVLQPDLKKAQDELRSNAKFAAVATALSKDNFAQRGGQVPMWFSRDDVQSGQNLPVPPPVLLKAWELQPGQYSQPIKVVDNKDPAKTVWAIVNLDAKEPAKTMPFEEAKELVVSIARQEKAAATQQKTAAELAKLIQDAEIEVNRPEWQPHIQQFRQELAARMQQGQLPGAEAGPGGDHSGHNHPPGQGH